MCVCVCYWNVCVLVRMGWLMNEAVWQIHSADLTAAVGETNG